MHRLLDRWLWLRGCALIIETRGKRLRPTVRRAARSVSEHHTRGSGAGALACTTAARSESARLGGRGQTEHRGVVLPPGRGQAPAPSMLSVPSMSRVLCKLCTQHSHLRSTRGGASAPALPVVPARCQLNGTWRDGNVGTPASGQGCRPGMLRVGDRHSLWRRAARRLGEGVVGYRVLSQDAQGADGAAKVPPCACRVLRTLRTIGCLLACHASRSRASASAHAKTKRAEALARQLRIRLAGSASGSTK